MKYPFFYRSKKLAASTSGYIFKPKSELKISFRK